MYSMLEPCRSKAQAVLSAIAIGETFNHVLSGGQCPTACQSEYYVTSKRTWPLNNASGQQGNKIMLLFRSGRTLVTREVLLVSFSDIVASVGGSLGLFLGFSCLDAGTRLSRWAADKWNGRAKKGKE